ncbi:MAG: type II toxin-antitoxin system RelE/ParE family toxin [Verrucomicrobia bacterium]|nr:type II toxin-antitoxin system RelE/ParE family toxin [Verrucomicrobiota bacterium]MBV8277603.1 type II toxin-antitoxin system RelE/ParE family toxin [Verrucomicrobiota bacterium]
MRIEILSDAEEDLIAGTAFYERQGSGLGDYFLNSIYSDIDSLLIYAGIHRVVFGFHRALSKRFPYAIFYRFNRETEVVQVYRVLDLRRDPSWIQKRLKPPERSK